MNDLIERCNRMEFPLREFIDRTLGSLNQHPVYRRGLTQRELEEERGPMPPITDDMISHVYRPADRIAFHGYEQLGGSVGHTAGLENIDFG